MEGKVLENYNGIISESLSLIKEKYVFGEVADKIIASIERKLEGGYYEDAINPEIFVKEFNNDLLTLSNDKHLSLHYTPEKHIKDENKNQDDFKVQRVKMMLERNHGFAKVEIKPGNIGYLELKAFSNPTEAGDKATSAMSLLSDTYALIIDLRDNGGGDPNMVAYLTSFLLDSEPVHLNSFVSRNQEEQFWSLAYVPGKRFENKPVYVLTSKSTFSAAEEFSYNLQQLNRGTVIGEVTAGGANPGRSFQITDHYFLFVPTFAAKNPITKTNWEGVGVVPDIKVKQSIAYKTAYQMAVQHVLENHMDNGMASRHLKEEIEKEQSNLTLA
jgi:C-terminal processing protease CtpA/Prc